MEDLDDATADAILALQLHDLADLWVNQNETGMDQTDMDLAMKVYRQELQSATTRFQDHRISAAFGETNDNNLQQTNEPNTALATDALEGQASPETGSMSASSDSQSDSWATAREYQPDDDTSKDSASRSADGEDSSKDTDAQVEISTDVNAEEQLSQDGKSPGECTGCRDSLSPDSNY